RGVLRQEDGDGAHSLVLRVDAWRLDALAEPLRRSDQAPARHDDALVGGHEVLARAVLDRSHAFLYRGVLHREALDAGEAAALLLRLAVHQVVVVLVRDRAVGAGNERDVDALAVLERLVLLGLERP